ncbi:MAG: S9 family peptidase [Thaumarchaeota archaeon]|nr:S9 family peptidase [Candidatus Calditenuaceae archaeon]MCX8202855.1 S9 family peptidase [Nitrososphaeria archaeon]MDW8042690.1 S9 family peptidase [Nitrososphaerota archaeon]
MGSALERIESVLRTPDLVLLDLSRDDERALALSNLSGSHQLWAFGVRDGGARQVTHGDQRVTHAAIAPDSRSVAFARDFGGAERHQLFLTSLEGEPEVVQVSEFEELRVSGLAWSPKMDELAVTGSTSRSNVLIVHDLRSRSSEVLFESRGWVFSPAWHERGDVIAASAVTTEVPRSSELVFVHVDDGSAEVFTPKPGSENVEPRWHPSDPKVLFKTNSAGEYDIAVHDLESESTQLLGLSGYGVDFTDFGWLGEGGDVWFAAKRRGRTRLCVRRRDGSVEELPATEGTLSGVSFDGSGSVGAFTWSSLSRPPALFRLDVKSRSVSEVYSVKAPEGLELSRAEFVTYRSFDGLEVPAFLVLHSGLRDRRACVVWVHGGPWSEVADEWNAAIQAISVAGFHVLCPNFRGSTGYGAEFERMNVGDPGGRDLMDVLRGVEFLRREGLLDDDRVAIVGASYGGFMAFLAMVKHPEVWRAGAAIVGVTDWEEMYRLSDAAFRNFIEQLLGKPEARPELFRDRSPINFVHRIRAPILVWHRANDSRCPLRPVVRFVERLKELGRPHEFHVVEGEGHGPQRLENFVRQYKAVVDFLLRHLS